MTILEQLPSRVVAAPSHLRGPALATRSQNIFRSSSRLIGVAGQRTHTRTHACTHARTHAPDKSLPHLHSQHPRGILTRGVKTRAAAASLFTPIVRQREPAEQRTGQTGDRRKCAPLVARPPCSPSARSPARRRVRHPGRSLVYTSSTSSPRCPLALSRSRPISSMLLPFFFFRPSFRRPSLPSLSLIGPRPVVVFESEDRCIPRRRARALSVARLEFGTRTI